MRAAIYCRLSDEDRDKLSAQDDSASIANQKAMLVKFADSSGWSIVDIYSDDDCSGADRQRPEFNRLLSDARAGKFDIVLCKSQSRFTREMELVERYIHGLFPELGIRFISLVDHADTEDAGNKRGRQISGLVNEWFLEELSDNIKAILTSRRRRGYHIGSSAPYGYRKDPEQRGHLIIDPEAASTVREIFSRYLEGWGKQAIARKLNEQGVPNPTAYKRIHGLTKSKKGESSLWTPVTITGILTNEVYRGHLVQGKQGTTSCKDPKKRVYPREDWIIVRGTHEPIISREVWDKAWERMENSKVPSQRGTEGIFSGKVRCLQCGGAMASTKNGTKRGFRCRRHGLSRQACPGSWISLPKLERTVMAQLKILSEDWLDREQLEAGIDPFPELRRERYRLEAQLRTLEKKISGGQSQMRSRYLDKVRGSISGEAYSAWILRLSEEKEAWEKEMEGCREGLKDLEGIRTAWDVEQYLDSRRLTREMVSILIHRIYIGWRDQAAKDTPVEIHWNF